ncbi:hypothetical protein [Zhengella sp.]
MYGNGGDDIIDGEDGRRCHLR